MINFMYFEGQYSRIFLNSRVYRHIATTLKTQLIFEDFNLKTFAHVTHINPSLATTNIFIHLQFMENYCKYD